MGMLVIESDRDRSDAALVMLRRTIERAVNIVRRIFQSSFCISRARKNRENSVASPRHRIAYI